VKSILLIHTGGVGDFLQTFPVLDALRHKWPMARITILGHPERAALACLGGLADQAADFETSGCHRLFVPHADLVAVPPAITGADLILNFLPQETFQTSLARAAPSARVLPIRSFPPEGHAPVPAAQFVYDQISAPLGLSPTNAVPRLRLECSQTTGGNVVAIHPGSGAARKNWPGDRFRQLAAHLSARGATVRWILGPAEADNPPWPGLVSAPDLLPGCPLADLARFLASVRLFVGNDSGIAHLAAAVGAPTVALFGPSNEAAWGPRGENVRIVKSVTDRMDDLATDTVVAAAEAALA
jgi:ADP-heptose:LPS heptosyltransferase